MIFRGKNGTANALPKAIMFDIDNTLLSFDGYVKTAMRDGFARFGLGRYEDAMFFVFKEINDALWKSVERGEIDLKYIRRHRWDMIFERLGIRYDGPTFEKYFSGSLYDSAIPEEGAFETLEYLFGKYPLYLASNGPTEQQKHRLEICGMDNYFRGVFVSEDLGVSKPSREFFRICLERIRADIGDISPEEIMMTGDSVSADISGAVDFKMQTCYYTRGKKPCGESGADIEISSLSEIKHML